MIAPGGTLWGYPKGVFLLSFTELWERFSYYGMLALLVLFLTASADSGGLGWERDSALKLYGLFTGLIFTMPVLGGWIANQFWGERRCILIGGVLLIGGNTGVALAAAGAMPNGILSVSQAVQVPVLLGALGVIALGTGLLKPAISSIVGRFFDDGDRRRDAAFAVFFTGIYIGSLSASLIVGFLGERIAWCWGFAAAAVGMTVGMLVYLNRERPYLADLGRAPVRSALIARRMLTVGERNRIKAIVIQGLFTIVYAAAFYQKGGLLTLFAREHLNRSIGSWEVPVTWLLTVSTAAFILATPLMARLWQRLEAAGRNPSASTKLAWGLITLAIGYVSVAWAAPTLGETPSIKPSWGWLALTYLCFGIGDALVWPIQISMVSRLAPSHLSALFVGGWYITIGLGSWLTGYIGALGYVWGLQPLFCSLALVLIVLGTLLWRLDPRLKRLACETAENRS